jgi:hypothetical protein
MNLSSSRSNFKKHAMKQPTVLYRQTTKCDAFIPPHASKWLEKKENMHPPPAGSNMTYKRALLQFG